MGPRPSPSSAPDPASETLAGASLFSVEDLGLADYAEVYRYQRELVARRKAGDIDEDQLILVEHPAVYTYGRKIKQPVLPPDVPSFAVERGGEITYHNPGQLVAYPILALGDGERDLHLHLRRLESTLIDTLAGFGIRGERRAGATGVWVVGKEKKIASIGIAVSGWVTYHGIALNVSNDLAGFLRVNPCGFAGEVMTSMQAELGDGCPTLAEVKAAFVDYFAFRFERQTS